MTDCTCLTGDTAAVYVSYDVELANSTGCAEGLVDDELESLESKVLVNVLAIDGYIAVTGVNSYASNGFLSSTCSVEVGLCTCIQDFTSVLSSN